MKVGFESGCEIGGRKRCGGRVSVVALRCWNWEGTGRALEMTRGGRGVM